MQLSLETDALFLKVVRRLSILGKTGLCGFFFKLYKSGGSFLGETLLSGDNVHRKLLEVREVHFVKLIEHGDILHERYLVLLENGDDAVHAVLALVVFQLEVFNLALCVLEYAEESALFLRVLVH